MRTVNLYVLYDLTARITAGPIQQFHNDATARRAFADTLASKDILPNKYPEQFDLLLIGRMDEETGQLTTRDEPITIMKGRSYKEEQEKTNNA